MEFLSLNQVGGHWRTVSHRYLYGYSNNAAMYSYEQKHPEIRFDGDASNPDGLHDDRQEWVLPDGTVLEKPPGQSVRRKELRGTIK